jgi:DNA repair photolyase
MSVQCGSEIAFCDLPVNFDTYSGCSHGCEYCFAQKKIAIDKIASRDNLTALKSFISGKQGKDTNWCDWKIPIHWGGLSDPFQPVERRVGASYQALKVFAETKYPVIISTKNPGMLLTEPYAGVLKECRAVVQVSMVSPSYDQVERGAAPFLDRMATLLRLRGLVLRLIVRCQPYLSGLHEEIIGYMPQYKTAGVHGMIFEGMKRQKRFPVFVRLGSDMVYPTEILRPQYEALRDAAHANGLKFYSGDERLRALGDSMTCCGIDGLEGFIPNTRNLNRWNESNYTQAMKKKGTITCFRTYSQTTNFGAFAKTKSFAEMMEICKGIQYFKIIMGREK